MLSRVNLYGNTLRLTPMTPETWFPHFVKRRVGGLAWTCFVAAWLLTSSAVAQPAFYYSFPIVSSTNWSTYSVPLVETAGWTVGSLNGPAPTQAQFQSMLGSLYAVLLEFDGNGPQVTWDNVSLGAALSTYTGCTSEGWTTAAGYYSLLCTFGNPGPSMSTSGAQSCLFEAPGKFEGNQLAAYDGSLSFDAEMNGSAVTNCTVTLVQIGVPGAGGPFSPFEWGYYGFGQAVVPASATNVVEVTAGQQHVVALRQDGTVVAWGANGSQTNVPAGLRNVVAVSACGSVSLALRNNGTVAAWGASTLTNPPAWLSNVVSVAAGLEYNLALRSDGTVVAWGNGFTNPVPGLSNAVSLTAGVNSPAGAYSQNNLNILRDGSVVGWTARIMEGSNIFSFITNLPPGLTNISAVRAGAQHYVALRGDGTLFSWGNNASGQTNVPTGLSNVVAITCGSAFNLALRNDGTVVAWGDNTYNQTNFVSALSNVVGITASSQQSVAIIGNTPPVQLGLLTSPQLANGSFSVNVPTQNGRVYSLEFKDSLSDATWSGLPLVAGTGSMVNLSDPTATAGQRFYRVRRW